MNFYDIKDSQEEMETAIRRHNEQVTKQITDEVFGGIDRLVEERAQAAFEREMEAERQGMVATTHLSLQIEDKLNEIIARQRQQILQAMEALQRGNTDDAKRILEEI